MCCQQHFNEEIPVNKQFMERLKSIIADSLIRWEKIAIDDMPDKHRLMVLCSLSVLYYSINKTKSVDKKILRSLCSTQKRIAAFHLVGDILFTPLMFLQQQLPPSISQQMDKKLMSGLVDALGSLLDQQADQLSRELQSAVETVSEWKTELRSLICQQNGSDSNNGSSANQLVMLRCTTVLKGARMADKMSRLVKCVLNGHLSEDRAISKSNAQNIFRLIELIKVTTLVDTH
jgi:hypothetical protein